MENITGHIPQRPWFEGRPQGLWGVWGAGGRPRAAGWSGEDCWKGFVHQAGQELDVGATGSLQRILSTRVMYANLF